MKKIILSSNENYGERALKKAVGEIIEKIGKNLPEMQQPISMYLAGGVAINFYTGYRSTRDIDASFSRLILLPKKEELTVAYEGKTGGIKNIYLDTNYNTSFAVIHPDHEKDSLVVEGKEFNSKKICLKILNPVDLAVSKIARFVGKDKEDIEQLALFKLITAKEVEERTKEALDYYVGNTAMLYLNVSEALDIINQAQYQNKEGQQVNQLLSTTPKEQISQENLEWAESIVTIANNIFQSAKQLDKIEAPSKGIEMIKGNNYQLQVNRNTEILTISFIENNRAVASYNLSDLTVITANPTEIDKQSWDIAKQPSQIDTTQKLGFEL